MRDTVRAYYQLIKPGVTYGNVLTAVAGYFLAAAHFGFSWTVFIAMTVGQTLIIGGACALNNYYDRDIDEIMERTKKRPSVVGSVSRRGMFIYPFVLLLIGIAILAAVTNWLTVAIGITGFVTYVWLYGVWTKRTTIHGTAVGAVSGALPIAGGYAAASGVIDLGMVLVFLIIFFWQFPEFYSIAIYRRKEYAKAKIPVMPVVVGVPSTILQIFIYTVLYVASTLALTLAGYTGWVYFLIMLVAGLYWIYLGYQGFSAKKPDVWARAMFKVSMYTILGLCLMLSIGALLP